jgi:Piwi domain.
MKNNLTINLIPYRIISEGIDLYFSEDDANGHKITLKWVPSDLKVPGNKEGNTYWSLENLSKATMVHFNFVEEGTDEKNRRHFTKRVFNQLLYNHFEQNGFIIGNSFVKDTRILVPAQGSQNSKVYQILDKFSLKVEIDTLGKNAGVFLSYGGQSSISKLPLKELNLQNHELIGKVVYKNRVFSKNYEEFPENLEDCQIILNRNIGNALGIPADRRYLQNKYREHYNKITDFYNKYLSGKSIGGCFELLTGGFTPVSDSAISSIDEEANLLEFKNHVRNVNVYDGLKRAGGPFYAPALDNLQFLFIFMDKDKESANSLYSFMNKGLKNFPGLEKYISVPFNVDFSNSLRLQTEQTIITEVDAWLQKIGFDPNKKYFVLYISPINKNEDDEERNDVYFKIKELLLQKDISSQVVFKDNLGKDAFNFYLPNIAVAILAKLGGIPWRLPYPLKKDLIIGIGAYKNADTGFALIGNAICFRNDGQFEEFKVFPASDVKQLGESLKNSIKAFAKEVSGGCNRLIIHYYKVLGPNERKMLDLTMKQLDLDVPYIFVTVNDTENRDYIVFDEDFEGKMPRSGTIVRLRFNEFLLCNNTRYESNTGQKLLGYPFPVKVRVNSQPKELANDFVTVREILNQVYEFSRIYWKSVRQRNKPVTIEYSELIAKVVSQFKDMKLPTSQTATKSLWFL